MSTRNVVACIAIVFATFLLTSFIPINDFMLLLQVRVGITLAVFAAFVYDFSESSDMKMRCPNCKTELSVCVVKHEES